MRCLRQDQRVDDQKICLTVNKCLDRGVQVLHRETPGATINADVGWHRAGGMPPQPAPRNSFGRILQLHPQDTAGLCRPAEDGLSGTHRVHQVVEEQGLTGLVPGGKQVKTTALKQGFNDVLVAGTLGRDMMRPTR